MHSECVDLRWKMSQAVQAAGRQRRTNESRSPVFMPQKRIVLLTTQDLRDYSTDATNTCTHAHTPEQTTCTSTHAHARTHARMHTHTQVRKHACTHAHTRTRMRAHSHPPHPTHTLTNTSARTHLIGCQCCCSHRPLSLVNKAKWATGNVNGRRTAGDHIGG